jgi:hypothetical protein
MLNGIASGSLGNERTRSNAWNRADTGGILARVGMARAAERGLSGVGRSDEMNVPERALPTTYPSARSWS